ncbi:MAG: hypothetical protein WC757_02465 [Candidatus Paceibacterota bacterium]|jgi:hypothetical protein
MNKNNLVVIGGGIILLVLLLGGLLYWGSHPDLFLKKDNITTSNDAVKEMALGRETFDSKEIKNLPLAVVSIQKNFSSASLFYRFVIAHPQKLSYASTSILVGTIKAEYNDGTSTMSFPLIVKDGIAYIVNGYGGNLYLRKESNWKDVYKNLELINFEPMDRFFSDSIIGRAPSQGDYDAYKKVIGIEKILLFNSPSEIVERATVVSGDVPHTVSEPISLYSDIEILKYPENAGIVNPIQAAKNNRILAGVPFGESVTFLPNFGIQVLYPEELSGNKVVVISEKDSLSFHVSDEPVENTVANVYCDAYPAEEVGPALDESKISSLFITDIGGVSWKDLIKSWGYSEEGASDVLSFTTTHAHCVLRVSGGFRTNMFHVAVVRP